MALLDEYMVGVDGPWSDREAAHLWRRAGFGARPEERETAAGNGDQESFRAAVDSLVNHEPFDPNLDALEGGGHWGGPIAALPNDDSNEGRTKVPADIQWLQAHLFYRMLFTSQPLQEQYGLFLHDHLVSEFFKVFNEFDAFQRNEINTRAACCQLLLDQYALFRDSGLDDYRELLINITRDPAMLLYLDNYTNGLGEGRAQENFAREVMELFSMGVDNYSEEDVREIARCLTGESLPHIRDPGAPDAFHYGFRPGNHELGSKTVFGHTIQESVTGQETIDVIDLILEKVSVQPSVAGLTPPYNTLPATAVYISWKLLRWFVNQNIPLDPPHPAVLELADYLRGTDGGEYPARRYPYDMRAALGKLFLSKFFHDRENYFAITKTPADFVVMSVRLFNFNYDRGTGSNSPRSRMESMGMGLFRAPDVDGWAHGRPWINASYLIERYNWIEQLVQRTISDADIDGMQIINGGVLDPNDDPALIAYFSDIIIQDDLEDWAPGTTVMLYQFLTDLNDSINNVNSRFREKVRGLMHLLMTLPLWQMK